MLYSKHCDVKGPSEYQSPKPKIALILNPEAAVLVTLNPNLLSLKHLDPKQQAGVSGSTTFLWNGDGAHSTESGASQVSWAFLGVKVSEASGLQA